MPNPSVSTVEFECHQSDESITRVAGLHVQHQNPFTPYDEAPAVDDTNYVAMPFRTDMAPQVVGEDFRHRMGTKPLDLAQWLPADAETAPTIEMKRQLLSRRRNEVVSLFANQQEQNAQAANEAAELVGEWAGVAIKSKGIDALVEASLLVADDLAVLRPMSSDTGEQLLFVAGVVCAPSRWTLEEKMGQEMMRVHKPVARYAEHIGAGVDTALQRLDETKPIWRSNWTIEDHPALFQPVPPKQPLVSEPEQLWIRMERQTLRRLSKCNGVLFTIRGYQQPLGEYVRQSTQTAQTLRILIERLPDDVSQYKSVLTYRPQVLSWINQFC